MEARTIKVAPIRKSIVVKATAEKAFSTFTAGIARWWPAAYTIGTSPQADVVMEPRAGGRWFERGQDGSECDWGKVLVWDPPRRVLVTWQIGGDWQYHVDMITEMEVTFTALGTRETRVEFEHRKLEAMGDACRGHPRAARIRLADPARGLRLGRRSMRAV